MKLVPYLRTSTEDKGQNPLRQLDVIEGFAAKGGHELLSPVIDEGTSGTTDPLQRQQMRAAIEAAEAAGADGIVVEAVDRATRGGIEALMVFRFHLRLKHKGMRLIVANSPPGLTPALEEMFDSILATVARMFVERLREQIKSGLARAKAQGWPRGEPGRKPKPGLTEAEAERVKVVLASSGLRKTALEVSKMRGAFDVADPKAQRERAVSCVWLRQQVLARQDLAHLALRLVARRRGASAAGQVETSRAVDA